MMLDGEFQQVARDAVAPVIAFCQQPCGFLPRRFLVAKIDRARQLQAEIGGRIVFFLHDADHDLRESRTPLRNRHTGHLTPLAMEVGDKIERKYTPLSHKRLAPGWQSRMARSLPAYLPDHLVDMFATTDGETVADFCLDAWRRLGVLDGIEIVRASDPAVRRAACEIADRYVDLPWGGTLVRARLVGGRPRLHAGGDHWIDLPPTPFTAEQISPARDDRFRWMQSVIACTHYVAGASERDYLQPADTAEVIVIDRDQIGDAHAAWVPD